MIYLLVDESDKHGSFYSNFYGGILIHSSHYNHVLDVLTQTISDLHIDEEIKWQKVNEYWLERYTSLVDVIYSLMANYAGFQCRHKHKLQEQRRSMVAPVSSLEFHLQRVQAAQRVDEETKK